MPVDTKITSKPILYTSTTMTLMEPAIEETGSVKLGCRPWYVKF